MKEFTVIIERAEEGWFVGSVVELTGCHTQGKTVDELMKRIKEAIKAYLDVEGFPVDNIEFVGIQR